MADAIDPEPPEATPEAADAGEPSERRPEALSEKEVAELEVRMRENRRPYDRDEQAKRIAERAAEGA
jgi:hypothetical protein